MDASKNSASESVKLDTLVVLSEYSERATENKNLSVSPSLKNSLAMSCTPWTARSKSGREILSLPSRSRIISIWQGSVGVVVCVVDKVVVPLLEYVVDCDVVAVVNTVVVSVVASLVDGVVVGEVEPVVSTPGVVEGVVVIWAVVVAEVDEVTEVVVIAGQG